MGYKTDEEEDTLFEDTKNEEEEELLQPISHKGTINSSSDTSTFVDIPRSKAVSDSQVEENEKKTQFAFATVWTNIKEKIGLLIFTLVIFILLLLGGILLWKDLTWEAWVSIIIVVLTLLVLIADVIPSYFVMMVAMSLIMTMRILTVPEALAGFSNEGLITIGVLFIIAKAIEVNKVLDLLSKYVLGSPKSIYVALLRVILPVALSSAFMNNTPIVAMMIPAIQSWCKRCNLPQTQLLMPLSFAAIIGGTCTIIGTSTNLIVATLAQQRDPNINLGFFEIAYIGIPNLILCTTFMLFASPRFLKGHKSNSEKFLENPREYTTAIRVEAGSIVANRSITESGIKNFPSVSLISLQRGGDLFQTPSEDMVILPEDILVFSGVLSSMRDVYAIGGLVPATNQVEKVTGRLRNRCLVEVVIAPRSPLVGLTVKQSQFRHTYNAAIIAVHRRGERINQKIEDIKIKSGDTLLVETNKNFIKYHQYDQDFALLNVVGTVSVWKKKPTWKTVFTIVMTIAMVVLSTIEIMDLVVAAFMTSCIFVMTRCVKFYEMNESVQGDLLLLIACAFSLGKALEKTEAASQIAESLLQILEPGGTVLILFGVYLITSLLTAVISNAATVTLMFPIAYEFTLKSNVPLKAIVYVLMMAGSSSFATPIGYQTNLMVQGPGGYSFVDFVKLGLPLTFISMGVTVGIVYAIWCI